MIKNAKLFLFDLDGTVYLDGELIGNAKQTLQFLRGQGAKIVYLTNNSSRDKNAYVERLKSIGILESGDIVYSSLECAVDYYKRNRAGKKVYVLSPDSVKKYLINQGMEIVSEEDYLSADIILLAFDTELTYDKIKKANDLMVLGKEYIATHPDSVCPAKGISIPDVGAMMQMFKASSGREADIILGKPYGYMVDYLLESIDADKSQTFMVGDRLYTDIKFGIDAGLNTILVLSGETSISEYEKSGLEVTHVLKDINCIPDLMK